MKNLLLIFALLFLLPGCITSKKCAQRFPCKESTASTDSTHIKDSLIKVSQAKAQLQISVDSLRKLVQDLPIVITDSSGQAQLKIWRNKYNNLLFECLSKPEPVTVRNTEYRDKIKEVIKYVDKPVNIEVEKKTIYWPSIIILSILLFLSNFKRILRFIKPI